MDIPNAALCLSIMIRLFNPPGNSNELFIESSFQAFAMSLTNGYRKIEHCENFVLIINAFHNSATSSPAMRLKLKGTPSFMTAIKKSSESACEELKECSNALIKTLKQ